MKETKKLKLAFLIFASVSLVGLISGVAYLESGNFAELVKRMIGARAPEQLGVVGDFSNLKLYFFPPGIGVANPKITVARENISKIPMSLQIEAKELRVNFAPIQMFSGVLQVSELSVQGGAVQGTVFSDAFKVKASPKNSATKLNWKDLFRLQINGFHLEDTYLNLNIELPSEGKEIFGSELVVKELSVKKTRVQGRDGFVSLATVNAVKLTPPVQWKSLPIKEANQLQWNLELTDQGLKLDPFVADLSGIRLKLVGLIAGNLLDENSDPSIQAEVDANTDLGTFFLANLNDQNWDGEIEVKAKIQAKLRKLKETLKGDFTVQGKDFAWKKVKASRMTGEGTIDLKDQKISLKELELVEENIKTGEGKVRVTAMQVPLKFDEPFDATVNLNNADLHWLGGAALKDVYAIEALVSGKIQTQFLPGGAAWKLKAQTDLKADHFGLTNQHLDVVKEKKYILHPRVPILIEGPVEVSAKGVDFPSVRVKINQSDLNLTGGVHGPTGFDLFAKGKVDLKDIGEISENEVKGAGDLEAHIHGPSSATLLDFDAKLKDASYLGMAFGNVNGRLTYDDGTSELRFTNLRANQKNTFYTLSEGFIDLSGSDDLHLPFEITSGRIEDFQVLLEPLVKKVSWFPKTLKGELRGKIDIGGKIATPKLIISSNLEGSDWSWMGERARKVKLNFGYDQGLYYAKNVSLFKTTGYLKGEIDFSQNTDEMHWNFHTENLSLNDVDFLDRLEIPAKSKIEITSQGSGRLDHLKSKSESRVYDTEIKGERYDSSRFTLEVGESTLRANLDLFGNRLSSQFKYALTPKQPSSFRIDLNDFDFSPLIVILNPRLLDDPELSGRMSGHVQLDFLSTQSELARGEIQIKSYELAKTDFSLKLIDPINVPVQLGYFHFPPSRLRFKNAELTMSGEGKKGDIDFKLQGQADMAIAEFFTSSLQKVIGKVDSDVQIKGPLKNLAVNGDLDFTGAKVFLRFLQTPFEEIDGSIRLRQGLISVENMEAYLGDEVFTLSGKIQSYSDRFPEMDLRMQLEDNKVKMAPLELVQARGTLTVKGTEPPYTVGGNLEVLQALWTRSFSSAGAVSGGRGDRFLPKDKDKQLGGNLFNLDLNVVSNQGFLVRNEVIDAEFKGKVRIVGAPDSPILLGEGSLIQGKVLFKDKPFIFESAKIEFDDPYQLNPKFNATAISEVNPYKIRVLAYGRSNSWKAEFTSTPFLPENEIFSVLASGYSATDQGRYKNRDRSYVSQGEAASLILHSMDFSKDVQTKTGLQFDVEEAVDSQFASSIFRPQNLSDNVAAPKLVIKRQVGRNIILGFGSTVGVGSENQKEVNAEYKLTPGMSALGVWNNIEEVNTRETRTSFGLDLKFNRRFK